MFLKRLCPLLIIFLVWNASVYAETLFPYRMPWDDASQNITNLAGWNDKPAGRDGFVIARDGHLYAGGKRLRLLGANIVFGGTTPTHEEADKIAARLARFGFNIVRFHHTDTRPAPDGLLQKDMLTLDPAQMDKFDYFIAALKRNGIYADINLHVARTYPGFTQWRDAKGDPQPKAWKGVDLFFPPMIAMQRDYARDLLTHRNPYTGNRYVDEPAVALIEINNENGLISSWRGGMLDRMTDPMRAVFQQQWIAWLRQHYKDTGTLSQSWGGNTPLGAEMLKINWNLQKAGQAQAHMDMEGSIVHLTTEQTDGTSWHVQLHQTGLSFKTGSPYTLHVRLRADHPLHVQLSAVQNHAPWSSLWRVPVDVGTDWHDYAFTFLPASDETVARLTVGNLGVETGALWLADASLKPGGALGLKEGEELEKGTVDIISSSDFQSGNAQRQRDWLQFLWDTESAYWSGMQHTVKDELGAKPLLVGTQVSYSPGPIQAQLDVVDGHAYWQHPHFPGKPWDQNNWDIGNSPMAGIDGAGTLSGLALRRIPGKPFIVTEYNHPAPSEYAAEALPLAAAYAALQDWDGLFVFEYGLSGKNWDPGYITNYFDINADPDKMSGLVAAAALFRRADVSTPGADNHPLPEQDKIIDAMRASNEMPSAAMFGVPHNAAVRQPVSLGSPPGDALPLPVRSVTGELVWGAGQGKTVTIDTSRSKGLIGAKLADVFNASGVQLQLLQARHDTGVLCATLMDGADFSSPGHILITALGTEENTGQIWHDPAHTTIGHDWGKAPVLAEGIEARITLPVAASRVSVWSLDERGNIHEKLPVTGSDQQAVIETSGRYGSLWYEVEVR
jgi:hypothetical protein